MGDLKLVEIEEDFMGDELVVDLVMLFFDKHLTQAFEPTFENQYVQLLPKIQGDQNITELFFQVVITKANYCRFLKSDSLF